MIKAKCLESTRSCSHKGLYVRIIIVFGTIFLLFGARSYWSNHHVSSKLTGQPGINLQYPAAPPSSQDPHETTKSSPQSPSKLSTGDYGATYGAGHSIGAGSVKPLEDAIESPFDTTDDTEVDNVVEHHKYPVAEPAYDGPSKAIVVASTSNERTNWFHENFPDWDLNIYVVDDKNANLTLLKNKGREAAVYLTYIINHYNQLPDYIVFSHSRRYQWHNDDPMYDGVGPIKLLQLPHVQEEGYVSLRCAWNPGCPEVLRPSLTEPQGFFGLKQDYARVFRKFFPDDDIPKAVGAPCCAQFAVTREQICRRPLQDYKRFRRWLWSTSIIGGKSGRIFEYMWHYIFFMPIKSCPPAPDCYCKTFGLCNLKCPNERHCLGRYAIPPFNKPIPKGWPHPKKQHGFVKDKWWEKFYPPKKWDGFEPRKKPESTSRLKSKSTSKPKPKPGEIQ